MRGALVLLAACSSKGRSVEDARSVTLGRSVEDARSVTPVRDGGEAPRERGDVRVRVEWKDTPTAARSPGGLTPCGTASAPAVAPTTTWGIPDAIVMIDAVPPSPAVSGDSHEAAQVADSRIEFDGCTLSPRAIVGGTELIVASASHAPAQVALIRIRAARPLVAPAAAAAPRVIHLPVIGHEVAVPLRSDSMYRLTAGPETAMIVVAPSPYYAVTEANGQAIVRDVPTGTFGVAALIPERAGQPARLAAGVVTVKPNTLTPITVAVADPP